MFFSGTVAGFTPVFIIWTVRGKRPAMKGMLELFFNSVMALKTGFRSDEPRVLICFTGKCAGHGQQDK